jgi:predicted amino acid racemase
MNEKIEFIGSSSDHMIIDITHAEKSYHLGSIVDFSLDYGALLAACTSEYVCKQIV